MKRDNYISWDEYFMGVAILAAMRSKDPNTQVGACIIDNNNRICCIQLRTLLQYFGTEVCRNNLSDMIWVDSTMTNAINIVKDKDFCIIPDVRHKIERNAIKNCSLYGGVIVLKRGETSANHSSEDIDFTGDITIENNGSLMQLFYKVLNYLQNI